MRKLYPKLTSFDRKEIEGTVSKNDIEYLRGWIASLEPEAPHTNAFFQDAIGRDATKEDLEKVFWTIYTERMKEVINKGADVTNFGDPVQWQKDQRKDRI